MNITFALPFPCISGGIRVTFEMANQLLNFGYNVRIACKLPKKGIKNFFKKKINIFLLWKKVSWIQNFKGKVEYFSCLDDLEFANKEIVIAVGTFLIHDVYNIRQDVIKLRYCHGFSEHLHELTKSAWSLPMPTIAVSHKLVSAIKELTGEQPIAIIPNGIKLTEYYKENYDKDGIGTIFSSNKKKAPEDTISLMKHIKKIWPSLPRYVFSAEKKPKELRDTNYYRSPSINKARELYNRSKIWVVTSRSEGFCLPILEAMACDCAVISTDHDTASGLITHGENGFLVSIGDIDTFIKYIDILLKDDKIRNRFVQNGHKTVKKYTWENAAKKMDSFLKNLTNYI